MQFRSVFIHTLDLSPEIIFSIFHIFPGGAEKVTESFIANEESMVINPTSFKDLSIVCPKHKFTKNENDRPRSTFFIIKDY
jgi:hypothetical protein